MTLSPRNTLDLIELIFYVPALGLSVWVSLKHGFGRQLGWIYLSILGLVRIVGSSTGLAYANNHSTGLMEASFICYGIGLSPLLLAMLGVIQRVNDGMQAKGVPARALHLVSTLLLVGLIVGIVGSIKSFDSNPATRADGLSYLKGVVILYAITLGGLSAIAILNLTKQRFILEGEKRLIHAAVASIPFLAVRMLYSILSAFAKNIGVFNSTSRSQNSVVVQAIMSSAMEFIVVLIYLAAGLMTTPIPRGMVRKGYVDRTHDGRKQQVGTVSHHLVGFLLARGSREKHQNAAGNGREV